MIRFLTFIDDINVFLDANQPVRIVIDAICALFVISFLVFLCLKYRKALHLTMIGLLMLTIYIFADLLNFKISKEIYYAVLIGYICISVVLLAPELRKLMEYRKGDDAKKTMVLLSTQATKEAICDAVFNMASNKIGALISIELQQSLEQYAENAITLNSDVSRELLEQIFIKDSPLHDGGVIIRGNKIVCAAAYYTLTQNIDNLDKTIGSRHRAGLGLSEATDALTIIVSEETGDVHVATVGFMKLMANKNELLEYLNFYMGN